MFLLGQGEHERVDSVRSRAANELLFSVHMFPGIFMPNTKPCS